MIKLIHLTVIVSFLSLSVIAQSDSKKEKIKQRMWGTKDPDFEKTDIPDKWKNESAVIICKSLLCEYRKPPVLQEVYEDYYWRIRVKLLDKAAVNEFSEISVDKLGGFLIHTGTYIGIKVIKPDGTEKEVDFEQHTADVEDAVGEYIKIAIPDLEPGDIIDYYICQKLAHMVALNNPYYQFTPFTYSMVDEYPIIRQKFSLHIRRKSFLNMKSLNGAPELKLTEQKNKNIYTLVDDNREAAYSKKWYYPNRSVPTIKFQAVIGPAVLYANKNFRGKHGIAKTFVSDVELLRTLNSNLEWYRNKVKYEYYGDMGYFVKKTLKYLSKNKITKKSPEEIIKETYYYLRFLMFVDLFLSLPLVAVIRVGSRSMSP